jgi:rod shape-determining protein MreC
MTNARGSRRWVWIVVLLAACLLAGIQSRPGARHTDVGTSAVSTALRPAQGALSAGGSVASRWWGDLTHLGSLGGEVERLRREAAEGQRRQKEADEMAQEVGRLRALLSLRDEVKLPAVAARAIARSPSPWFETLTLDVGSHDQIEPGAAVLAPGGLLGQVYQVSRYSCRVLCLTDRLGSVGARVAPARARQVVGVARGDGAGHCTLDCGQPDADVRPGDAVVSSGFDAGSAFPPGITVGYVLKIERRKPDSSILLTLRPAVETDRVEEVLVLLNAPRGDTP